MKRIRPHALIAAAATGAIVTVAIVDADRPSPGALATVHARIPELAQENGCAECHGGWFTTSMSSACGDCHEVVVAQIEAGAGLHGQLGSQAESCAACHSDHHGEGFAIVNARSFALAGVPNPERFDHARVGFAMAGRHLELDCTECHANAEVQPLPAGEHRFLGLHPSCTSCHDDPHENRLGRGCEACHDQTSFDDHRRVGHDESLPLVGGHADLDCRTCHESETPYALERLIGPGRRPAARACADCHESPHALPFIVAHARAGDSTPKASCVACHAEEHESFRSDALVLSPQSHATAGFRLDGPHGDVACADCHDPDQTFEQRYPGRAADACGVCHDDPHAGQFDASPLGSEGCLACHDRAAFDPHTFDARAHARATLPLQGAHLTLDCEECHTLTDSVRVFRGTPATCAGCHADAHRGAFDAFAAELETAHGSCAACHDALAFDRASESGFDHQRWTEFPLLGAHDQAECASCHRDRPTPDETGRTFGRVEHHFGPYQDCSTCHTDPHSGRFDAPRLPQQVDGRTSCARCHVETSFRAFADDFDHGRWTGFALTGAHARTSCSACHAPLARPDAHGRTWSDPAGTSCANCHADPHAGQFAVAERTDCRRCHKSSEDFAQLVFDHERDARFALGGNHADVACAACHKPVRQAGVEVIRYRPLSPECADCHGVDQGSLRRRRRGSR